MSNLKLESSIPNAEEYCDLRRAAGLSPKALVAAQKGLPNTLFGVCMRDAGQLVGMGRIIGDGGCNFEVVDIAVHPDYQRRGLGTRIMQALVDYLEEHAPETAYVSMIADEGAPALYAKFGFEPTAPVSIGMARRY